MPDFTTREEWLNAAAEMIAAEYNHVFGEQFQKKGVERLSRLHVSAGFPSERGANGKVIGQCWNSKVSRDKFHHIFISPLLEDPVKVIATLAHEMVHAADDGEHGHKGVFTKCIRAMGLVGKPTATEAGPEFIEFAKRVIEQLGKYPHVALRPTLKSKTQKTYMLKVQCPGCDCVARLTQKWLDTAGMPTCGCGTAFEEAW